MASGSRKAVLTAIVSNGLVTTIKFIAALISGSAAMMNEAVHSLMDTLNQLFLFFGLREAERPADERFAFGHQQKKYLWNLWSAIGLFSIGSGLGLAHALNAWNHLNQSESLEPLRLLGVSVDPLWINLLVLGVALLLEGYSFLVALRMFLQRMRQLGRSNPLRYLVEARDPTLVAVVLEDSVAMIGLLFAALGIGLTAVTGNEAWDVLFSGLIALMLGLVAFYLGYVNMQFLADMRDEQAEQEFRQVVAQHAEVERLHDLRSIVLDEKNTILVAEIELREETLVPAVEARLQQRQDQLGQRQPDLAPYRLAALAAVQVTLERSEQIIDELELTIRERLPRIKHITLEVEGISGRN